MTTKELGALLSERNAALDHQTHRLPREQERANERIFRTLDPAIVAELRRRKGPVRVGKVELRLTADRQHFAECDPATGRPIWIDRPSMYESLLYRYPGPAAARRWAGV